MTVFDGQQVNGKWIIRYTDDATAGFNSSIDRWSLEITYSTVTDISQTITIPSKYELSQNYPNPFNPSTEITYELPKSGNVKLSLYDVSGKELAKLVNQFKSAGKYSYTLSAENFSMSSGVYFYKLEVNDFTYIRKMLMLK